MKRYVKASRQRAAYDAEGARTAVEYYLQHVADDHGSSGYVITDYSVVAARDNQFEVSVQFELFDFSGDSCLRFFGPLHTTISKQYFIDNPDSVKADWRGDRFTSNSKLATYQKQYDADFALFSNLLDTATAGRFVATAVREPDRLTSPHAIFRAKLDDVLLSGLSITRGSYDDYTRYITGYSEGTPIYRSPEAIFFNWSPDVSRKDIQTYVLNLIDTYDAAVVDVQNRVSSWPKYRDAVYQLKARLESEFPGLSVTIPGALLDGTRSADRVRAWFRLSYNEKPLKDLEVGNVFTDTPAVLKNMRRRLARHQGSISGPSGTDDLGFTYL